MCVTFQAKKPKYDKKRKEVQLDFPLSQTLRTEG
jgi:hypothetical protein